MSETCAHTNSNNFHTCGQCDLHKKDCTVEVKYVDQRRICSECKNIAYYNKTCGCFVCSSCQNHFSDSQNLVRCFCGYGLAAGERLPDDDPDYDGDWF